MDRVQLSYQMGGRIVRITDVDSGVLQLAVGSLRWAAMWLRERGYVYATGSNGLWYREAA